MNWLAILAQTTAPTTTGAEPPALLRFLQGGMMPLLLALAVLWFLMFRSKGGEKKKREQMLNELKKGVRVQTIGGILGTVLEVRDTEVVVKVDESTNTKMRFARSAIHRVLDDDAKAESK
ncbi:MAG: preprotein translocase subunit YajC [Anaerolineae bacterium]|nr:preprotein translocase subunit YajC [Phycisphaerae bacterium]